MRVQQFDVVLDVPKIIGRAFCGRCLMGGKGGRRMEWYMTMPGILRETSEGLQRIYADKECGIGRSSCGNLISIIENFAERDENGQVIESITECYRNYSSSQLVAMVGMPESMKQQVTPDMSVRAIQKMRKGIPDKQAAEAPEGKTADTKTAAKAEPAAIAEAAGQASETVRQEVKAQEPAEKDTASVKENVAEQGSEKPAAEKAAAGETEKAAEPVAAEEPPAVTESSPITEPDARKAGDSGSSATESIPAEEKAPQDAEKVAAPAEAGSEQAPREEKGQEASSTLFTFDSYSTYHKAQKKVNELMEKVFSGNGPVTVKIVCVQG